MKFLIIKSIALATLSHEEWSLMNSFSLASENISSIFLLLRLAISLVFCTKDVISNSLIKNTGLNL
ncbi:hypothetical protein J5U21_01520 [Saccharolobus shibatae]|uniref:Uncharacterized protein n=1 Tax=Saccharolobus shibatae TaxID=2286 RepID=A0A8F5BV40_9CREN|nr:hypothetical protein J5U21_01520 [Saccharolobus shibatae]